MIYSRAPGNPNLSPTLNRDIAGFAGMALRASQAMRSKPSGEELYERLRAAAKKGDAIEFRTAFLLGAPWFDPQDPNANALGLACKASANSAKMLSFLQGRGACALGVAQHNAPAQRGSRAQDVFALEMAIDEGNWEAAGALASAAAGAFAHCAYEAEALRRKNEPSWTRGDQAAPPKPRFDMADDPEAPRWDPELPWRGDAPLLGALNAVRRALMDPQRGPAEAADIARFLRSALVEPDFMKTLPTEALHSLFEPNSFTNPDTLILPLAVQFPVVMEALLDAGAEGSLSRGRLLSVYHAANAAKEIGAEAALALLKQKANAAPGAIEFADPVAGSGSLWSSPELVGRLASWRKALQKTTVAAPVAPAPSPPPKPLATSGAPPLIKRRILQPPTLTPTPTPSPKPSPKPRTAL